MGEFAQVKDVCVIPEGFLIVKIAIKIHGGKCTCVAGTLSSDVAGCSVGTVSQSAKRRGFLWFSSVHLVRISPGKMSQQQAQAVDLGSCPVLPHACGVPASARENLCNHFGVVQITVSVVLCFESSESSLQVQKSHQSPSLCSLVF